MSSTIKALALKAISPRAVHADGPLTSPRSFGVYQLPQTAKNTRLFRFGNHPVRQHELEREFGSCKLLYLFLSRSDAVAMASARNGRVA
nr:putative integron gene cassette protein [uncultured bacterium]